MRLIVLDVILDLAVIATVIVVIAVLMVVLMVVLNVLLALDAKNVHHIVQVAKNATAVKLV